MQTNWPAAYKDCKPQIDALLTQPRATRETRGPAGSALLGQGESSDVWGIKNYAVKLYRINTTGLNVPELMHQEIETYKILAKTKKSPLRKLYYYKTWDTKNVDGEICGFVIFQRSYGKPLTIKEIRALPLVKQKLWQRSFVKETILIENALSKSTPIPSWRNNYADPRITKLKKWFQEGKLISKQDAHTAFDVMNIISSETNSTRYIHGDYNLPNILVDLNNQEEDKLTIHLIDPLVSNDPTEANWRHFTMDPDLALCLAEEYEKQRGIVINQRLMFAIGALTHLYMSYILLEKNPEESLMRKNYLEKCAKIIKAKR